MKNKRKFRSYQEKLIEDLKDQELAHHYLNAALMDEDPYVFLLALKDVYAANNIEMTTLAKKTKISRESLYRILSKKGNPKFNNVISLLDAAGFSLAVMPNKR